MKKYNIILADDHPFLIDGIANILKENIRFNIMFIVTNGIQLMSVLELHKPDLVLLDLNMPLMDGIQCLIKIKAQYPSIKVLILSNYKQHEMIEEVKRMKADGYLVKDTSASELNKAIKNILSNETYFPIEAQLKTVENTDLFFDDFFYKYELTKREVEIIKFYSEGKNTLQIAESLFVSEFTINTHRRNIYKKLNLKNFVSLLNFAKNNLIVP